MTAWELIQSGGGELVDRTERFLRAIARKDLAGRPLYIVQASSEDQGFSAFTSGYLDLQLRSELEKRGKWKGRGSAILMREYLTIDDQAYVSVAIHELAHIILQLSVIDHFADIHLSAVDYRLLAEAERQQNRKHPWAGHESQFIRAYLHLVSRAQWLGFTTERLLCAGQFYGLSDGREYLSALGREPFDHADNSLVDLLAVNAPEKFTALWTSDTELIGNRERAIAVRRE